MPFKFSLSTLISQLLVIFFFGAIAGFIFGHTLLAMLLVSLVLLAMQYRNTFKLTHWLWQSKNLAPPHAEGLWGRIFDGLDKVIKGHRKKQKKLNERIRRFRDGAQALPDAALLLSQDLTIEWSNIKAQEYMGIRWPGDQGLRIDNLLRTPEFAAYLEENSFKKPFKLISPVSSNILLELRFMDYGKEQILLLARDISKVNRIEEMRRDFVANVSHELKTPLTVVRGYVEMVSESESALDPHWQQVFTVLESQVTRMDRLVEQLLILSRIENNADQEAKRTLTLVTIIKQIVKDMHWLNQDKQHTINLNLDESIKIVGIETEIKSACANLISNAIAYTPAKGVIDIGLQYNGKKVVFSVKDNGQGIRPEDVNRLTERFYRVDKSRSRQTGGSGLGLSIVKHVLQHHNAELVIKSRWQEGSEFFIIFDEKSVILPSVSHQ